MDSFNHIPQIYWHSLSKIIAGLERPELISKGSRGESEHTSDFDDNDSNPSDVSGHGSGSLNEESQMVTILRPGIQLMSIYSAFYDQGQPVRPVEACY